MRIRFGLWVGFGFWWRREGEDEVWVGFDFGEAMSEEVDVG